MSNIFGPAASKKVWAAIIGVVIVALVIGIAIGPGPNQPAQTPSLAYTNTGVSTPTPKPLHSAKECEAAAPQPRECAKILTRASARALTLGQLLKLETPSERMAELDRVGCAAELNYKQNAGSEAADAEWSEYLAEKYNATQARLKVPFHAPNWLEERMQVCPQDVLLPTPG